MSPPSACQSSDDDSEDEQLAQPGLTGRAKWLKVNTAPTKRVKKDKPTGQGQTAAKKEKQAEVRTKKVFEVADDITEAELEAKIKETAAMRGRRNNDTRELMRHLVVLIEVGTGQGGG